MLASINGLAAASSILSNTSTSPPSSVMFAVPFATSFSRSELAVRYRLHCGLFSPPRVVNTGASVMMNDGATPSGNEVYTVNDFMTRKEQLHILKPTTTVDKALEMIVQYRISGFPVVDDNWKLVGVVSDYDLLALDSISGDGPNEKKLFPEVDRTWKTFNEIQKLLSKNQGRLISDVMSDAPLVVRELTNLEDAARLLLQTKYRRLPVLDASGTPEGKAMALSKAKEIVSSNAVVVFSKSYCPYCKRVKDLFSKLGVSYKVVELDVESDGSDMQSALAEWSGQRTVPNVFIKEAHIGGCDSVMGIHRDGKLIPLLTDAGAIAV